MKARKIISIILSLGIILTFYGCKPAAVNSNKKTITLTAMDTVMTLTAYGDSEITEAALEKCSTEISRLDTLFSYDGEGSDIYNINMSVETPVTVSDDTISLISKAKSIYDLTGGAFDITVKPLIDAWGFITENKRVPDDEEISSLLALTGSDKISLNDSSVTLQSGMSIDFGGIAKGYAAAKLAKILRDSGVDAAILSLGGNVQTVGKKSDGTHWTVAVENPDNTDDSLGTLLISDEKAIVTSGDYQRYFEADGVKYHHILDPKTGKPADSGLRAVTVICADPTLADGLSTAFFVMGEEKAREYISANGGIEALFVSSDGKITVTDGLKNDFAFNSGSGYEY